MALGPCPWAIAGVAYIKVDGEQWALRGNLTISPMAFARTPIAGMDGIHGYSQAPQTPYIEADISDLGGLALKRLETFCNVTVTVELLNGKVYVLANAWVQGPLELNGVDGTVTVRFDGMSMREMGVGSQQTTPGMATAA